MSELPDDIKRALSELPRERQPDPALEDRVVRAALGRSRRTVWMGVAAAAAAAMLFMTHPWSPTGETYVLLLSPGADYLAPAPGHLEERRAEYGRWADSLARAGKLDVEGHLEPPGNIVDGLFIIRAADDADAARIAATCPHIRYRGHIEVRRFVE
ncbi:MAG TPA: YciI family protein [Gemmatimonadaceae bacterium]|jgi:hypothetical protein|nr:YciI family protein [Gemmatimonadaceae bacterium]